MEKRYRTLSYVFLILISVYIGLGQYVIVQGIGVGTSWQTLFTGPVRLQVQDNVLRLKIKISHSSLELKLLQPIKDCLGIVGSGKEKIKGECSSDRDWILIYAAPGQSLRGIPIVFNLASPQQPEVLTRRYITNVRIDRRPEKISSVYQNLIETDHSNVKMYYPFHVFNISSYFAELFGIRFMWLISSALLVLLACQLFLFLVSFVWQPAVVTEYFESGNITPVSLVDDLANRFAIPLGFLGTVTSIWYSLETAETDYSSFVQVLDAMRVAVFTTVLGLFIKILCLIRGYRLKTRARERG
jgi:hypothetical protein